MKEKEQHTFRHFINGTKTLITALKSGKQLEDLFENCESLCDHSCTNDYKQGTCKIKAWIQLLAEAERENIIPSSTLTFLEYINFNYSAKTFYTIVKHFFLHFTLFFRLESAKSRIIEDLEFGFSIDSILSEYSFEDDTICRWLSILKRACKLGLIPNDDVLSFLIFI